jgi:hypothetical protein
MATHITSSNSACNLFDNHLIPEVTLQKIIDESGFHTRSPRKVHARDVLSALCDLSIRFSPSFNDIATHIEANTDHMPSRQAIANRFNLALEKIVQASLTHVIDHRLSQQECTYSSPLHTALQSFKRVIVQDSTIIKLPTALFTEYSGVSNATTAVCNARIQATYDLKSGCLISFSLDPYSKNDPLAASETEIREGDFVLRDRGYLTVDEIQRHLDNKADCIYRHKTKTTYLDEKTSKPIDLLALLKKHKKLDMIVLCNNKTRTKIRLLAAPVDDALANKRRRKAKKDACGHNPSAEVLALMNWTIFLTTLPAEQANFQTILTLYGIRWRIEIIFKAWKGGLKFDMLHNVSSLQLRILVKARLLMIVAGINFVYRWYAQEVWRRCVKRLSLLKLIKYISMNENLTKLLKVMHQSKEHHNHKEIDTACRVLSKYCCYDKRKKRMNFNEIWDSLA